MDQEPKDEQKRPSKFYQSRGIALGVALGLIFGAAVDQIGVGLVLGIAAGTAIGRSLEVKANERRQVREMELLDKRPLPLP